MRADFQTFRSAASVSRRGIFLQVFLTAVTIVYGVKAHEPAAMTGAIFMGLGAAAWLVLAIIFDQHRRERIEAMEIEALAAGPTAGTSVFEAQEDFRPAAKRLQGLYKFMFPVSSLLIALTLIAAGIFRYLQMGPGPATLPSERLGVPLYPGWGLGLGIGIGALGFVVARYAAGLAKQPVWGNLKAGAAFTVGTSLIWLSIAVAHLVDFVGPDLLVRWLPRAMALFLVLIGAEMIVQFLLALYRPRRAGEMPRAAFESRLLGFAAAPDRIAQSISEAVNYQLGFDVTGGWAYRLLSRSLAPLGLIGALVIWLLTAVVVVQPHQRAMILRFGSPRTEVGPGPHLKWMWPIETTYIPEFFEKDGKGNLELKDLTVTGLRQAQLGSQPAITNEAILWTNDHVGEEVWQYVRIAPGAENVEGKSIVDVAAVSVEIPMEYRVKDVAVFDRLAAPDKRDDLLRSVARRETTQYFQQLTLEEVLGGDRSKLSSSLKQRVQAAFDKLTPGPDGKPLGAGVEITILAIANVHPPKDTASAFEAPVLTAQRFESNLQSAQSDAIQRLTEVVGDASLADSIIAEVKVDEAMKAKAAAAKEGSPEAKAAAQALVEHQLKLQEMLFAAGGSTAAKLSEARRARWEANLSARGEAVKYTGKVALYGAAPELFKLDTYYDSMRTALANSRVLILSDEVSNRLNLDIKPKDLGTDIFKKTDN
ncbi:MAG: SPFH domain-containing protein [Phycisphaerales bacterium]|jgi:regulator of protease activity HflC (stomatin/prohibitin superfamily)